MNEKRPLYYALSVAIVLLTLAVSYRIVNTDGDIDVQGTKDGIQVKISQAQDTIDSAQKELAELAQQLDERKAALEKAESNLKERQQKVSELLDELQKTQKPRPAQVKAVKDEIETLGKAPQPSAAIANNDAMKTRVARLSELQQKLAVTSNELKATSTKAPVKK